MTIKSRRNLARSLRRRATEAERELWRQLRARIPIQRSYFRRQVPLGSHIVDFVCFKHRLVIELDGSQHGTEQGRATDIARTQCFEQRGFRVLRFWNHQVFTESDAVLDAIHAALQDATGAPALSFIDQAIAAGQQGYESRSAERMQTAVPIAMSSADHRDIS